MYVVVDTEGSGLFDFKKPADAEGQPRLAALAMLYVSETLEIERTYHEFIRPDGWEMSPGATAVNNLTTEYLREVGVPILDALDVYASAINAGRIVVAFNAQHDCKTMRAELRRAGLPDLFEQTKNICCMRASKGIVPKLKGKGGFPNLGEACTHFNIQHGDKHSALGDALACLEVMKNLERLGALPEPNVYYAQPAPEKVA